MKKTVKILTMCLVLAAGILLSAVSAEAMPSDRRPGGAGMRTRPATTARRSPATIQNRPSMPEAPKHGEGAAMEHNARPDAGALNNSSNPAAHHEGGDHHPNGEAHPGGDHHPNGEGHHDGGNHHGDNHPLGGSPKHHDDFAHHPHHDDFEHNHQTGHWHDHPLPPPHRDFRPAPMPFGPPIVPPGFIPYPGAPVIDAVLGLSFGILFDASLDYLYTNDYYIDGYDGNVVYLRDVTMMNLLWPDVMLSYDNNHLANAQFIYSTPDNDRSRFDSANKNISAVYGPPIAKGDDTLTWFGGETKGYITLTYTNSQGRYFTTISVGK